ncbi:haloacid dehalogenase-like hydrolase [Roseicitreum antarcticum]|uniref:Phosphoserine phosphatase n=1 Tax=Roseicitreum antarcticum TaxID=564137 RepID=A0A1H2UKT4_9RHOB|nr:haloacid dehalogenase-like hydrolase [Roseicitreum antarcticum]SDW56742.1 Phosphoserine phosphatase [Roseicitreum antarcticum]
MRPPVPPPTAVGGPVHHDVAADITDAGIPDTGIAQAQTSDADLSDDGAAADAASGPATLAVDLDGTLIRSDVLFESFWRAFAREPRAPLRAVAALMRGGRPGLKRRLAALGPVDVTRLPYNRPVLDLIAGARASGQHTALVTAADQGLADAVAGHLGLFDAVHGSQPGLNLKGSAKAAFLRETYGAGGYVYAGDSTADLKVWPGAAGAVTVTHRTDLRARVDGLGIPVTHLSSDVPRLGALRTLPGLWEMAAGALVLVALLWAMPDRAPDRAPSVGSAAATVVAGLIVAGFALLHLGGLMTMDLLRRADEGGDSAAERAFGLPRATLVAIALAVGGVALLATTGAGPLVCAALFGVTFCLSAARRRPAWGGAVFTAGRLSLMVLAAILAKGGF